MTADRLREELVDVLLRPAASSRLAVCGTALSMQALAAGQPSAVWLDGQLVEVQSPFVPPRLPTAALLPDTGLPGS